MARPLLLVAVLAVSQTAAAPSARAQTLLPPARAVVDFPTVLGRGGAGVALPTRETALFVNPAHAAATPSGRLHVTIAGVHARTPIDTRAVIDAVDGGDSAEVADLTQPAAGVRASVLAPSASFRAGDVGVAMGGFANGAARAESFGDGPEAPLHVGQRIDGVVAGALAIRVPRAGLAVGLAGKWVRRYASLSETTVGASDPFGDFRPLTATAVSVDLGTHWQTPVAGLAVGAAVHDLLGSGGTYAADDPYGLFDAGDPAVAARLGAPRPPASFRLGAAYRLGRDSSRTGLTLAADWVPDQSPAGSAAAGAPVRLGVEGALGGVLRARAGLNGAHPSVGLSLSLLVLEVDYAWFSVDVGEGSRVHHAVLVRLGVD